MNQVQIDDFSKDFCPVSLKGWKTKIHTPGAYFPLNPDEIKFYLTESQKRDKIVTGYEIQKELVGKTVLNTNVLDYHLLNQDYISNDWKKKDAEGSILYVFFWGITFVNPNNQEYVRCIYFDENMQKYSSFYYPLCRGFYKNDPAAVLASTVRFS